MLGWEDASRTASEPTYALASWLFLRLLGLIYFVAFASLATQIQGLVGSKGILPATDFLASRSRWGVRRFYRIPTLCWFNSSDRSLLFLSWTGAALSLLLVAGIAPTVILALLWLFYLSLFAVGRIFLGYQWDILLLEIGFLAIFLAPLELAPHFPPVSAPPMIVRWLFWWLLFRLMFSSGMVKLRSADPAWRKLTALCHHYETQPLPPPLAWHAHQLPKYFHSFSASVMFVIELFVPFLIIAPPPLRHLAAFVFMVFMALIQLTGNYCFFNLLGIALSILLLDDTLLQPAFRFFFPGLQLQMMTMPAFGEWIYVPLLALILLLSLLPMLRLFRFEMDWPKPLAALWEFFDSFRLVNSYGLFSVMTTQRPEIIVEGSRDGVNWLAYEFKWKPGDPKRAPRFVAPHQPRLDWQVWFAALGYYPNNPWFWRFLVRLLEGSPTVLSLLRSNPFPDAPPRFVRAVIYDYQFTDVPRHQATKAWWFRERRGPYSPVIDSNDVMAA